MKKMDFESTMDRRTALATLAAAGVALALHSPAKGGPVRTDDSVQKSLSNFTDKSRQILQSLLQSPSFSGQIPANGVHELLNAESKDVAEVMLGLLALARTYSHPPISNYRVGAVARGISGSLYLGMNIEIPGHSLGFSVHGEQAALSNAYMHAESGVTAIAVTAAPCGHCRQFMNEMSPEADIDILVQGKQPLKLSTLLPLAFGPKDLGFTRGAFPVRQAVLRSQKASGDQVTQAAQDAASHAYAPYSKSLSGVAIGTKGGRIHEGAYIENAAFNPSLSPLQVALTQLLLAGGEFASISRVVLAESKGGKISQAAVTRTVLSAVAPKVELQLVGLGRA